MPSTACVPSITAPGASRPVLPHNPYPQAAIAILELSHGPFRQMLTVLDNSTGHGAYAEDALRAKSFNLGPAGEQPAMPSFQHGDKTWNTVFQVGDITQFKVKVYAPKTEGDRESGMISYQAKKRPTPVCTEIAEQCRDGGTVPCPPPRLRRLYLPYSGSIRLAACGFLTSGRSPYCVFAFAYTAASTRGPVLGEFRKNTVVTEGHTLVGVPKGAKQMFMEMGLWRLDGESKGPPVTCKHKCAVILM